jgi:hypothetical protein
MRYKHIMTNRWRLSEELRSDAIGFAHVRRPQGKEFIPGAAFDHFRIAISGSFGSFSAV